MILARVKSENLQVVSSVEASSLPLLSYMLTFNPKMYEASESGLDQVIWVNVSYRLTAVGMLSKLHFGYLSQSRYPE